MFSDTLNTSTSSTLEVNEVEKQDYMEVSTQCFMVKVA
jgi:hypothetical protein